MKYQILIFLILTSIGYSCSNKVQDTKKYVHIPPTLPQIGLNKIAPGDVIIRKGNGPLSFHLMAHTKEDYTHSGIIVKEGEQWKVLHTIGGSASDYGSNGIRMIDIQEFVRDAADSMLFIIRPVFGHQNDSLGRDIAQSAKSYLKKEIPFDHGFSMFTTEKYYCTELLYYIFKDVYAGNIFVVKKKHKSYMLMFSTFFNKNNFKPIFHLRGEEYWHSSVIEKGTN